MKNKKIILLAGHWETTPVVYNFLKKNFGIYKAIIEEPVSRKKFLQKRIKKLGIINVTGQILFQLFIVRILSKTSRKRVRDIYALCNLDKSSIPEPEIIPVLSVNAQDTIEQITRIAPELIIVHGTRIISKNFLQTITCPVINIHAGITPRYRGSHGAYWALVNNDKNNCGVTVHFVDKGIDTGNILGQKLISFTSEDNFSTYPLLQLYEGLNLLKTILPPLLDSGKYVLQSNTLNSALWHHPTLWGYLYTRILKGIK